MFNKMYLLHTLFHFMSPDLMNYAFMRFQDITAVNIRITAFVTMQLSRQVPTFGGTCTLPWTRGTVFLETLTPSNQTTSYHILEYIFIWNMPDQDCFSHTLWKKTKQLNKHLQWCLTHNSSPQNDTHIWEVNGSHLSHKLAAFVTSVPPCKCCIPFLSHSPHIL